MSKNRVPPDKSILKSDSPFTSYSPPIPKEHNPEVEVVGKELFKVPLLTKPSNVSHLHSAQNMKEIIQGKYFDCHIPLMSATVTSELPSFKTQDDGSSVEHYHNFSESIRHDTVFPSPVLPPKHLFPPISKPENSYLKDIHLKIKHLLTIESTLIQPELKFEVSDEAAEFNWLLLSSNDFNLEDLLHRNGQSVTCYGSEFKPTNELEKLLAFHPRWPALKDKLDNGSKFPVAEATEESRLLDLHQAFDRGNHKSALKNEEFLAEAIEKETKKGWLICIPEDKFDKVPNLVISPMGVADQLGVTATGDFAMKRRVTHDLSFPGQYSGESINSRVIKEVLEPCMFGHALVRIIHYIVNTRSRFPNKKIWIRKEDLKSAYRRMHLNAETSFQSAIKIKIRGKWYIFISARLPFGGSPCPNDFCLLSDIMTDTVNDLLDCNEWQWNEIHSSYLAKIPNAIALDESIPYAQARKLSVDLPVEDNGKADVFVDDIISVAPDINDNLQRLRAASCTVLHAFAHKASSSSSSSIKRDNLVADDKNEAEGAPEELKIVLGWTLDSRRLLVKLPFHKWKAWKSQIESALKGSSIDEKTLSSIVGRLENVAVIIKMMGHFLNNLHYLLTQLEKQKYSYHRTKLNNRSRHDLELSLLFLDRAHAGINMNLITFRSPDIIHIGDASEHGMGAFASHGRAWRYLIPENLRGRAHINLLEFLTQVVSIWIDILEKKINPLDCILAMGDSTTAIGWMRRSNFKQSPDDEDEEETTAEWLVKQEVARKLASLVLTSDTVLYHQWFKGCENVVADSLSRDAYFLSNSSHEKFLHSVANSQLPHSFQIKPVPAEICCFITSTLQQLPVKKRRLLPQKPSETALGNAGLFSSKELECSGIRTSKRCPGSQGTSSSPHLPKQSEKPLSLQDIQDYWWKEQSTPPLHTWHRPSGQTTGLTQDWTQMARNVSYFKSNSEDIKMKTGL